MSISITTPLSDTIIRSLRAGDEVLISGLLYTGRDAAHKRITEMIKAGLPPPFDFNGQIIYYAGPSPAPPGRVIGSVGPTTSTRMDAYAPFLIGRGLKAMLGKGLRSSEVVCAIKEHTGIYFAAIGGAAALIARCVTAARVIAFEDLGPEAIHELNVVDLPAVVAVDCRGSCSFRDKEGKLQ